MENKNPLLEAPKISALLIKPRRLIARRIFWPVLLALIVLIPGGIFFYLDRLVWHTDLADLLPPETSILMTIAVGDNHPQVKEFSKAMGRLPNGEDLSLDAVYSYLAELAGLGLEYEKFAPLLNLGVISIAQVENDFVLSGKLETRPQNLRSSLTGKKNYRGETIESYSWEEWDVAVWHQNNVFFASTSSDRIERMIDVKKSSQRSNLANWRARHKVKILSEIPEFRSGFKALPESLVAVYMNKTIVMEKEDGDGLDDYGERLENYLFGSRLPTSVAVRFSDQGIYLYSAHAGKVTEPIQKTSLISADIPARLADAEVTTFLQVNNLAGRMDNNQIVFDSLADKYGIDLKEELLSTLTGRTAVVVGINKEGRAVVAFMADYDSRTLAETLGQSLAAGFKNISDRAHYLLTDKYLIAATDDRAVFEIINGGGGLNNQLSLPGDFEGDLIFSLSTPALVSVGKSITLINTNEVADLWQALDILTKAIPSISITSRSGDGITANEIFIKLDSVTLKDKHEAERIIERFTKIESAASEDSAPAVRDSSRRADLTIVESAIKEFAKQNGRAPSSLDELVPLFINSQPRDPLSGQIYPYANSRNDKTFYFAVSLETNTDLGEAGIYCLTSRGIKSVSGGKCREE